MYLQLFECYLVKQIKGGHNFLMIIHKLLFQQSLLEKLLIAFFISYQSIGAAHLIELKR